jgi:23S rRNA pseudouridine1911/1915/1917 synthase
MTSKSFMLKSEKLDRLDRMVSEEIPELSRNAVHHLIRKGLIAVNGTVVLKKSQKVEPEDEIHVRLPEPVALDLPKEDLGLKILHEDDSILVIGKPAGILTHPLHPGQGGTVVSGVLYLASNLSGINGVLRPGIVHRLDRETTGVLVVAKTDQAHRALQESFAKREVKKTYFALCQGSPKSSQGEISEPLGRHPKKRHLRQVDPQGKSALTRYQIIKTWDKFHLILLRPQTGRTHQIRVHLKSIGLSILHDLEYGGRAMPRWMKRVQLHAFSLSLKHPITKENFFISCPLEKDILQVIHRLNRGESYVG